MWVKVIFGMVRQKSGEMASPTPSIDSLNGVLALCDNNDHHLDTYSHVFSGVGSSSGVSSATSSSSASSLDRASTGSASSTSGTWIMIHGFMYVFLIYVFMYIKDGYYVNILVLCWSKHIPIQYSNYFNHHICIAMDKLIN